jgi:hypothetical protein
VADLPVELPDGLGDRLSRILDVEGKIPRALEVLGPVAGRDVLLLGAADGLRARQLRDLGARLIAVPDVAAMASVGDAVDVVTGLWSSFVARRRPSDGGGRVLAPGGRSRGARLWSGRRVAPAWRATRIRSVERAVGLFLNNGFGSGRIALDVQSMDDCAEFLAAAFDEAARRSPAERPRLSYA